jgi:hypothetical protein
MNITPTTSTKARRMPSRLTLLLAALLPITLPIAAPAADHVFVFAGQSNMVGVGSVNTTLEPGDSGIIPRVKGFYTNAVDTGSGPERQGESIYTDKGMVVDWATRVSAGGKIAGGSWQDYEAWKQSWTSGSTIYSKSIGNARQFGDFWALSLNPGGPFENGAMAFKNQIPVQAFGPELRVARRIAEARPGDTIYVIKFAVGGSNMERWTPPAGDYYLAMKAWVDCALSALPSKLPITGFFLMQGESDALNGNEAARYQDRLAQLITQVRSDWGTPNLPIVLGKIHPGLTGADNYATAWGQWNASKGGPETIQMIRQAQQSVAASNQHIKVIETEDLTLLTKEWLDTKNDKIAVLKDTVAIHLDQKSLLTLGDRMAAAWLEMAAP